MSHFIDSLKSYVSQDMISKASTTLGEQASNVSSTVDSIFASLMGVLLKYKETAQKKNILEEAGNLNILSDIGNIFEDNPSENQRKIGDDFLQTLLGDKAADFTSAISEKTGVSKQATNKLTSMVAPIFAGFFGKQIQENNWSMADLREEIKNQEKSFIGLVPEKLFNSFVLSTVIPKGKEQIENKVKTETKKGKNSWIMWVILAIILLLLLFWWRSCKRSGDTAVVYDKDNIAMTESGKNSSNTNAASSNTGSSSENFVSLPNGTKLQAAKGSMEEKMVAFLESDEYKNATEEQLKNKWFEFTNVDFEFGSPDKLVANSTKSLDNIAEILKYYKNAKIKIGGYADKVGSDATNMAISKQRAKTIETMLHNKGVGAQIISTEGFGEEYAKVNEKASDEERAKDRDMALRFVK